MNIRRYDSGLSILEITIAIFILILGLIPIYKSISGYSATAVETSKLAMAREILNSLKNEVMSQSYKEFQKLSFAPQTEFDMPGQFYITNLQKILDIQKAQKDFELFVKAKFNNSEKTISEIKATICWTKNNNEKKKEELCFLWVLQD
ncbi:MAG: hypothetical protein HQM10_24915 [Candidatus Riflebacteria bacterium]|nr:hypothetical protein [Candidatus Riflebacteria bacterium]